MHRRTQDLYVRLVGGAPALLAGLVVPERLRSFRHTHDLPQISQPMRMPNANAAPNIRMVPKISGT